MAERKANREIDFVQKKKTIKSWKNINEFSNVKLIFFSVFYID